MQKIPYTFDLLLPTLSPAATIAVYEDLRAGQNQIYKGRAIKARDLTELSSREVKHIGVNEINNAGSETVIEVFVY